MDEYQADRFESACRKVGARFSGGVFACAAFAEYELTGAQTYYGITPHDTRSTPAESVTPGWFASCIPVTVPVAGTSFGDAVRAAQSSFDSGIDLADVPFDRVLELASSERRISKPARSVPMLSYVDVRGIPASSQWDELNAGIYGDSRMSDQVCMWVNRFERETTVAVSYPQNPIARESVERYIRALNAVYRRVAEQGTAVVPTCRLLAPAPNPSAASLTATSDDWTDLLLQSTGATGSSRHTAERRNDIQHWVRREQAYCLVCCPPGAINGPPRGPRSPDETNPARR